MLGAVRLGRQTADREVAAQCLVGLAVFEADQRLRSDRLLDLCRRGLRLWLARDGA